MGWLPVRLPAAALVLPALLQELLLLLQCHCWSAAAATWRHSHSIAIGMFSVSHLSHRAGDVAHSEQRDCPPPNPTRGSPLHPNPFPFRFPFPPFQAAPVHDGGLRRRALRAKGGTMAWGTASLLG